MNILFISYVFILSLFSIFSYGFVDRNLVLSNNPLYEMLHQPLMSLVFEKRGWAGGIYVVLLSILFILYIGVLQMVSQKKITLRKLKQIVLVSSFLLLSSFPAFSYDIFNYITTANVTFKYKENPWVVMPNEIPSEPSLAYTRATNKVALYGPTWIILTGIPHMIGASNPWVSILAFKMLIMVFYFVILLLLFSLTKDPWTLALFGLNPLVLITVLGEGHNDIVMMALSLGSLVLYLRKDISPKIIGLLLLVASFFVKGATVFLIPLYFLPQKFKKNIWLLSSLFMFLIFLVTPLREEMYPWYATWFFPFISLLDRKKYRYLIFLVVAFTFGLMLRNIPYIVTREYSGWNQIMRTTLMLLPPVSFVLYSIISRVVAKKNQTNTKK